MARLPVAIIANSQTPYRLHVHQRIVREMPEVELHSLFTHELSEGADWKLHAPPEIGPVYFGRGQSSAAQSRWSGLAAEWRKGGRIIRWLSEHRVRAVVLCGYNDPGRVRVLLWCHRHGVPCFIHGDSNIRGDNATGFKRLFKKIFLRRIMRYCAGALPFGTLGKAYFEKYGVASSGIYFFPCEPDYALIRNLPDEVIEQNRRRFKLSPDRRRIVFCGRMISAKRPDLLIDAFIRIAAERPDWDLLMVGQGPLEEPLKQRVPTALGNRILWAGFLDEQAAVSALYRLSDALVLPSDYEPWALVVNEAAAAGLAIIASNVVGAAAELVRDGVNGRTFPPGDLNALINCLLDVTASSRIDDMKAASPQVLSEWRKKADPVAGLRQALGRIHLP